MTFFRALVMARRTLAFGVTGIVACVGCGAWRPLFPPVANSDARPSGIYWHCTPAATAQQCARGTARDRTEISTVVYCFTYLLDQVTWHECYRSPQACAAYSERAESRPEVSDVSLCGAWQ